MLHRFSPKPYAMLDNKWLAPLFDVKKIRLGINGYRQYWKDWSAYAKLSPTEKLSLADAHPCLFDRTSATPFDRHYFYQDVWAFKSILESEAKSHVDVGSRAIFVGMLTTRVRVTFIDIRPLASDLGNLSAKVGNILALPLADNSVNSLSCLHVAEHIGLGRYGDPLDPAGTKKAAQELARVLMHDGNLYFSLPVGHPRICFNAHRIHAPNTILRYFGDLKLVDFSAVLDNGQFVSHLSPEVVANANYACGLFHFKKE